MVKLLVFLHRRDDLSQEAFDRYYQDTHLPLVKRLPGLRRVVVNRVLPDPTMPAWDLVVEDHFDSPEAMQAALASPEGQAVVADAPNLFDMEKIQFLAVQETE